MRFGTNFRKLPEPEILTLVRQKKGRLKGHFRAQVPVAPHLTVVSAPSFNQALECM
jgi:hypothetical protein